jgi:MoaA/NifB/PqqE/SkfB family radical SAM enzyme
MKKETQALRALRAIEVWAQHVLDKHPHAGSVFTQALSSEPPTLVSAVMERMCNLQCQHCLFQDESSSARISKENMLGDIIKGVVRQMPTGSAFLHSGRIMRPWHLDVLADLRADRGTEIHLGAIDNGSFVKIMSHFERLALRLDWIDVSIDGDEESHNAQRKSPKAYAVARDGIQQARDVADKVTSLMTLTKLNSHTVKRVVETLLMSGEVDELHFTPASPYQERNTPLIVDVAETKAIFAQLTLVTQKVAADKLFYRMYRVEDIELLAHAVGKEKVRRGLEEGLVDHGRIIFHIDGVEVSYFPLSIWPQEEVLIDADGAYRVAGSGQFTLAEYRTGEQKVSAYTVEQLNPRSDVLASYRKAVRHWWSLYGKAHLNREAEVIGRIMS